MAKDSKKPGVVTASRLQFLDPKALADSLAVTRIALPEVSAPSLEALEVTVHAPAPLTAEDVLMRLHQLAREVSETRPRDRGEVVCEGDEVCLDMLAYARGLLIPFTAVAGAWREVACAKALPGFYESLAGLKVGDGARIKVHLPEDYPAQAWRGANATFLVDIRAAREVRTPPLESPALREKLGRGKTVDEVMDAVAAELEQERARGLELQGINLVLDEVARRARVTVPEALIEQQIRARWEERERPALVQKDFPAEDLQEALDGWLADVDTRAEVTRRLAIAIALRAIVKKDHLELSPEALREKLSTVAGSLGLPSTGADPDELLFGGDPTISNVLIHTAAVEHVMKHAKVHYAGVARGPAL